MWISLYLMAVILSLFVQLVADGAFHSFLKWMFKHVAFFGTAADKAVFILFFCDLSMTAACTNINFFIHIYFINFGGFLVKY